MPWKNIVGEYFFTFLFNVDIIEHLSVFQQCRFIGKSKQLES